MTLKSIAGSIASFSVHWRFLAVRFDLTPVSQVNPKKLDEQEYASADWKWFEDKRV
jgi:hypothetical protein